ncbi:MAG: neutral zinc metallopeptidase [Tessaracoccus sp.]|uniref:KPN_02809 family neutral zinc metallopeptidase n=1 Tax=Tessaracoccus sp. TaxID=1971211 RepID=UPI001EB3A6F1|nr:neutral zinc metallopeptidase [Tessaracoccus sp.]MBK7819699.1 neutral zinc metallopeptidase [Tessaracoccus sp.]
MEFRENVPLDQSRVRYGGGSGGSGGGRRGPGLAVGGGLGGILVLLLALFFGGNVGDLLGVTAGEPAPPGQQAPAGEQPQCRNTNDLKDDPRCRWVVYENALTDYWSAAFTQGFEPVAGVEIFTGQIATACGTGSSEMGPFYCPGDMKIYLDDEFMGQLLQQLGTERSHAAELYIVGHEYGHHISNLTGQMKTARAMGNQTGPKSGQVRLELQADCYAGAFFANTIKDPNSPIAKVTQDDLNRIVDAARAVGDDHIQKQSGGRVVPESWTHGSSAMRQYWTAIGFQSGDPNKCDTFSTDDLGG